MASRPSAGSSKPVIVKRAVWPSRMPEALRAAAEKRSMDRPASARTSADDAGRPATSPRRPMSAFVIGTTRAVQLREQHRETEQQPIGAHAITVSRPSSARPVYGSPRSRAYDSPARPASARAAVSCQLPAEMDASLAPLCCSVPKAREQLVHLSRQIAASPRDRNLIAQRAVLLRRTGAWMEAVDDYSAMADIKKGDASQSERVTLRGHSPGAAVRVWRDMMQSAVNSLGGDVTLSAVNSLGGNVTLSAVNSLGGDVMPCAVSSVGGVPSEEDAQAAGMIAAAAGVDGGRGQEEKARGEAAWGEAAQAVDAPNTAGLDTPRPLGEDEQPHDSRPGSAASGDGQATPTYFAGLGAGLPGAWGRYVPTAAEEQFLETEGISIGAKRELEDMHRQEERMEVWRSLKDERRTFGGRAVGEPSSVEVGAGGEGTGGDARQGGRRGAEHELRREGGKAGGQAGAGGGRPSKRVLLMEAMLLHLHVRQSEERTLSDKTRQAMAATPATPEPPGKVAKEEPRPLVKLASVGTMARTARYNGSGDRPGTCMDFGEVMGTKLGQINLLRAASALPGTRSHRDLTLLGSVLRGSIRAFRAFTEHGLCALAQAATFSTCETGAVLLREGEPQRCLFFVLEGLVALQQARAKRGGHTATTTTTMATKRAGAYFGSLPMMRPAATPSACSALTLERCLLLRMDEAAVIEAMAAQEQAQRAAGQLLHSLGSLLARMRFLASMRLSHSLSWEQALTLAALLQPRTYTRNQPVVQQGEVAAGLYILGAGRCASHRDILFSSEAAASGGEAAGGGDAAPDGKGGAVTRRVDADTLVARDIFGHESLLAQHEQTARHVLTYVPTTAEVHLLFLPRHDFIIHKPLLSDYAMREIKLGYRLQASDELLRQRHLMNAEWVVARRRFAHEVLNLASARAALASDRIGARTRRSIMSYSSAPPSPRAPPATCPAAGATDGSCAGPAGSTQPPFTLRQPPLSPRQQERREDAARIRRENAALLERIAERRRIGRPGEQPATADDVVAARVESARHREEARLAAERRRREDRQPERSLSPR